jgi:putative ABC transport system permease protein
MIIRRGLGLAAIGLALGLVGAVLVTRLMQGVLYGITATDPVTYAIVALVLLSVATLASWLPALRAARVDPLVALRAE